VFPRAPVIINNSGYESFQSHTARFDSISLDSGATLAPVDVAYETYGVLNEARSNAIRILHRFSGDATPPVSAPSRAAGCGTT